jgi:SAM-dependent methyltransferase
MRLLIKDFVKICAETLPISQPIYEFGSFQVPEQEGFANLRPFFQGKMYIGADMRNGPGVDVILNLHNIDLPNESVGTVIAMDTLEHAEFPRKALEEIHRILKPDGLVIISSVMYFPIHDYPNDYWRFTPEAFKSLLKPFDLSFVESVGRKTFPHTVVGIGLKGYKDFKYTEDFNTKVTCWKEFWNIPFQNRSRRWLEKLKNFLHCGPYFI